MTTNPTTPTRFEFMKNLESFIKVISITLGILFVFGLLISNGQLLNFGIADFSELNTRNIMVGALFVYYLGLLLLTFLPILGGIKLWTSLQRKLAGNGFKAFLFILILLLSVLLTGLIVYLSGRLIGYVSIGGRIWGDQEDIFLVGDAGLAEIKSGILQFSYAYIHRKQITAIASSVIIYVMTTLLQKYFARLERKSSMNSAFVYIVEKFSVGLNLFFVFSAFFLFLSGYATDVYPNMKFGLGGGQPQIVQLQVGYENFSALNALGVGLEPASEIQKGSSVLTQPVAIWYQSSKYLYITPLPSKGVESNLVAIDQDQVLGILYLRKYVKIESGGQITEIMPLP